MPEQERLTFDGEFNEKTRQEMIDWAEKFLAEHESKDANPPSVTKGRTFNQIRCDKPLEKRA